MGTSDTSEQSIFARLKEDHRQASALMELIEASAEADGIDAEELGEEQEDLASLFEELRTELLAHAQAEDEVVYAAFERHESLAQTIREAREEHAVVEHLLHEMERTLGKNEDVWMAKFKVLRDLVEHHVDEEELDLFEMAKDLIDADQSRELLVAFEIARERDAPVPPLHRHPSHLGGEDPR